MGAITILKSSIDDQVGGDAVDPGRLVPIATGLKLRGKGGRLTARLIPGGLDQLEGRPAVYVGRGAGPWQRLQVEEYSTYGGKLVVKLHGIDSADGAAPLVGMDISMPCKGLVDLPEGTYYIFELVGLSVRLRDGRVLGTVRRVVETGGTPLLAIEPAAAAHGRRQDEILVPVARSICPLIDIRSGRIIVDPPEGFLELYGV
jgi:16S rRNA processing protein RimM